MKSYALVHELLSLVEKFEAENEREVTLPEFTGFLLSQFTDNIKSLQVETRFGEKEKPAQDLAYKLDNNISRLLIFMYRYAKSYLKKALEGTPLQSPEDFTCLAILLTHESISKTELIRYNIQEKTSGTMVIARLINAGLVTETSNKKDKRGKLLSVSKEGKELLYRIFEHTSHVGKIITGKLSLEEKLILQYVLQKLEEFHHMINTEKLVKSKADLEIVAEQI